MAELGTFAIAAKRIEAFVGSLESEIKEAGEEFATAFTKKVKENIETQALPWEPLTEKWQEYKARHGLDPRILISTGGMVGAIDFEYNEGDGDNVLGYVTVGSGYEELAIIHEYGTSTIPPRPFIAPTVHEMEDKAEEIFNKAIQDALEGL